MLEKRILLLLLFSVYSFLLYGGFHLTRMRLLSHYLARMKMTIVKIVNDIVMSLGTL